MKHHDGTWESPWDEPRLTRAQALKTTCPKCLASPDVFCQKISPPRMGDTLTMLHPEREDGEIVRLYRWLKKNAGVLVNIPQRSF